MTALDGNVVDQNGVPVEGALVYIYDQDGDLAELTDALGQPADNPQVSGQNGYWQANVAEEGFYTARYYWGGRLRRIDANILAGRDPIKRAEDEAVRSQDAADFAEGFTGPVYASVSAGEAATTPGQIFRVSNGDGPPETTTAYRRTSGGSVVQAPLATTAALASTDGGKGDEMVATIQSGTGAVARTVRQKLRERVTPLDFGAAGDADPDDNTAGTDDTAAVQAALDYCATNPGTTLCLAGRFYKVQWCRVPHRGDERRFFIFGEGGGFVNPATSTTEAPCLYHSALANSGDASRSYNYSMGVTLDGVNFHGSGYGVGYMHAIAGHLHHANCSWQGLESGLLTSGVAGIVGKNTTFKNCERGHYAARIADIAWTAGYTQEPSTGWNDGVHYDGGRMRDCVRGILHRGSSSEGVLTVRGMILTGAYQSYIETHGDMHSVEISGTWCEYSRADESGNAQVDVFRFLDASGVKGGSGGEANGRFYVHDNVFFFSTPQPVGGVTRYAVVYGIYAEVRNLAVKGNFVHPGGGAVYTGFVYNNAGSNRIPIAAATSVTPASTANFTDSGQISIAGSDIDALGSKYSFFYMTDTGASPAKTYLLRYHSTAGSNYIYTVHQFQYVYSGQFPMHNANWNEPAPTMLNRIRPSGISVDLVNATTGLTFTGPTITLSPGINGSVSYDGVNRGALAIIEDNVLLGFDMTKVWQQGEFGRAILRNNSRGS